jgi:hypothetical protein
MKEQNETKFINYCKWCIPCHSTQTSPKRFYFPKQCVVSWYIHKCNFIYANNKRINFTAPTYITHEDSAALCADLGSQFLKVKSR